MVKQSTRLTHLHDAATARQDRYLEIVSRRAPQPLASLLVDNFFFSTALYTLILFVSLLSAVLSKAKATDIGKQAQQVVNAGKKQVEGVQSTLSKEKEKLERKVKDAQASWQEEQEELKRHFQTLMTEAEDKAHAMQGALDKKIAQQAQELKQARAEIEQAKKENAGETSDMADTETLQHAHSEVAAKEKQIHALELVQKRMDRELEHEKEMHESSKLALHDAVEKLLALKKEHK
ncbi:hypothetical protein BCR37DRAFT_392386 [Protomyces lactucae-debilis]|uniref:Uncharacterized protein n=1 Tax=Protomyces lactucae-debilis TaxID=2754530 RepID=A0A1Y2FJQ9_PROLT|nr:uncharacterized protein BCR37DRAFT_392386 [Protomyces lactucae-debilis]ORY83025.1 hypothetical protein BCR37DRAFT_392386 [Protomyces lactucae-debilis]